MATFFMFGKYSINALQKVSPTRTREAKNLVARYQGEIKDMYALLGEKDLVFIVELPSIEEAIKVSIGLSKLTGIAFMTSPAISVEEFDVFAQGED